MGCERGILLVEIDDALLLLVYDYADHLVAVRIVWSVDLGMRIRST